MEELGPTQIIQLENHGINNNDIQKLLDAGFHTIEAILFTTKKALVKVKGMSDKKVDKIIAACIVNSHIF